MSYSDASLILLETRNYDMFSLVDLKYILQNLNESPMNTDSVNNSLTNVSIVVTFTEVTENMYETSFQHQLYIVVCYI